MKICIDAGHGGRDPGAVGWSPFRLEEKEVALALAELLEEELESRGHWVVMSRRRDRTLSLQARVDFANRLGAELLVSLHANAASRRDVEGMEVFHFPDSTRGREFGGSVLRHMLAVAPGHRDRGVKPGDFFVLRASRMPAILVECEFLTHPRQLEFLASAANRAALAEAIANGIHAQALSSPARGSSGTFASTRRSPNAPGTAARR